MAAKTLRCVVVTPEKAIVDTQADSVVVPLYDGQAGFLPGRAPLVGRLKAGRLAIETAGKKLVYFIDGGIVQMKGEVLTLLTSRAVEKSHIDVASAQKELEFTPPASASRAVQNEARATHENARVKLRVAKGS